MQKKNQSDSPLSSASTFSESTANPLVSEVQSTSSGEKNNPVNLYKASDIKKENIANAQSEKVDAIINSTKQTFINNPLFSDKNPNSEKNKEAYFNHFKEIGYSDNDVNNIKDAAASVNAYKQMYEQNVDRANGIVSKEEAQQNMLPGATTLSPRGGDKEVFKVAGPPDINATYKTGIALNGLGKPDEAIEMFKKTLDNIKYPESASQIPVEESPTQKSAASNPAASLYGIGQALSSKGDYKGSVYYYNQALKTNAPDDPINEDIQKGLSYSKYKLGLKDESQQHLVEAQKVKEANVNAESSAQQIEEERASDAETNKLSKDRIRSVDEMEALLTGDRNNILGGAGWINPVGKYISGIQQGADVLGQGMKEVSEGKIGTGLLDSTEGLTTTTFAAIPQAFAFTAGTEVVKKAASYLPEADNKAVNAVIDAPMKAVSLFSAALGYNPENESDGAKILKIGDTVASLILMHKIGEASGNIKEGISNKLREQKIKTTEDLHQFISDAAKSGDPARLSIVKEYADAAKKITPAEIKSTLEKENTPESKAILDDINKKEQYLYINVDHPELDKIHQELSGLEADKKNNPELTSVIQPDINALTKQIQDISKNIGIYHERSATDKANLVQAGSDIEYLESLKKTATSEVSLKKIDNLIKEKQDVIQKFSTTGEVPSIAEGGENISIDSNRVGQGEQRDEASGTDKEKESEGQPALEVNMPQEAGKVKPSVINGTRIVEHAEDEDTATNTIQDPESPLTEKGIKQAAKLGEYIKSDPDIKTILTSDILRAKQTGEEAAKVSGKDVNVVHDADFNAINKGDKAGEKEGAFDEKKWTEGHTPNNSETFNNFKERAKRTFDKTKDIDNKDTLIVTNSSMLRALKALENNDGEWTDKTASEFLKSGEKEESKMTGINKRSLNEIVKRLGLDPIEEGEALTPEEYSKRGHALIDAGADVNKIIEDFKNSKLQNEDTISVVRAHIENLEKENQRIVDEYGVDSREDKESKKNIDELIREVGKKMGTGFARQGLSLQGQRDLTTGSFVELRRKYEEAKGKPLTSEEIKQVQKESDNIKSLKDKIDELSKKFQDIKDKEVVDNKKVVKKNIFELSAKEKLDKDKLKQKFSGRFNDVTSMLTLLGDKDFLKYGKLLGKEATYDFTEFSKKAIEDLGEKVKPILEQWFDLTKKEVKSDLEKLIEREKDLSKRIDKKENTPYVNEKLKKEREITKTNISTLSDLIKGNRKSDLEKLVDKQNEFTEKGAEQKKSGEKENTEAQKALLKLNKSKDLTKGLEKDISNQFINKKGEKFTPEESRDIWKYTKEKYLDKGDDIQEAFLKVSKDLGLSLEQVYKAITQPKGARVITDEMYKLQTKHRQALRDAQTKIDNINNSILQKFGSGYFSAFFQKAVFGHAGSGIFTHAGQNLYDPTVWKSFFKGFVRQYKWAYGDKAKYERAIQEFKNAPDYQFWKRNGLKINFDESTDDYDKSKLSKMASDNKILGKFIGAGGRGFDALKIFRYDLAKKLYDRLSDSEKADRDTAKKISEMVNHSTGTSNFRVEGTAGDILNAAIFAPRLEASRWSRILKQPVKTIDTLIKLANNQEVSFSDRAQAKIFLQRTGSMAATLAAALSVNQGLLIASGSKQRINISDSSKPDYFKFKIGNQTIDASGGMISTFRFLASLIDIINESRKELKNKTRNDANVSDISKYLRGKLSPGTSFAYDVATRHDFSGNTLPFSKEKPDTRFAHKLTWKEYLEQQTPIPVAEAFKEFNQSIKDNGVSESQADAITKGIISGALGIIGIKIQNAPKNKLKLK